MKSNLAFLSLLLYRLAQPCKPQWRLLSTHIAPDNQGSPVTYTQILALCSGTEGTVYGGGGVSF